MAQLKPEHLAELRQLYEQSITVIDWLVAHGHLDIPGADWKRALADAFDTQNLRGLRMAARDLRDILQMLKPGERYELARAVEQATGGSLLAFEPKDAKAAAAIVKRGKIRNDGEYYLLRSHIERLEADPARAGEAEPVVRLLDEYRVS
jgi:hypothetical protein